MEEGANAPPFRSKFERPSSPAISVESITETRIARLRSLDRSSQPDPLDLAECDLVLRPVVELSRSWRLVASPFAGRARTVRHFPT